MNILNSVLGDATGGRWQVVCQYSGLFLQAGHRVCMLLDRKYQPDPGLIPEGVELLTLRNRGHYDYPAAWRARRPLGLFAPDIAFAHCSRSLALLRRALAAEVPLVAVSHSNKVRRLLPADAYIALTGHIGRRIAAARESAGKPCLVIPNMIAIAPGRRLPALPSRQLPRIGALGRFDRVKGFDVFLKALAELKSQGLGFEAVLAGAGREEAALRTLAGQSGVSVDMPGWVDDVDGFLSGLDVLCVPARSDAFGLTPLQAAVAGVPLVLSRASGHREMFSENAQALFSEIDDPHSTAEQMRRILADQALGERLRQAAYSRVVAQYSESVVKVKIEQALDNILNNK